jgi:methionyl aminopeptidase
MNSLDRYIKSPEAIEKMRIAGKLAADVLVMLDPHVKEGITTGELNDICHDYMVNTQKAIPAALNYRGFPKSICTSINHVICHGIPGDRKLKNGDIINIDVALIKDGYYGDNSKMYIIGEASIKAKRLVKITQECLYLGISMVKPGANLKNIGHAIQQHAEKNRLSTVREYCGHGLGTEFHEEHFQVLHYDDKSVPNQILKPGLTFTIEPMINAGKRHTKLLPDNWTVVTKDHSLSAQWEHTLLVTESGCEILTLRPEENLQEILNFHNS